MVTSRERAMLGGVPLMHLGDLVTPIECIQDVKQPVRVQLVPAGMLVGKITERGTGKPIDNALVTIHAGQKIHFESRTADDGTYKITGIAWLNEYQMEVDDGAYFAVRRRGEGLMSGRSLGLSPGKRRRSIWRCRSRRLS